MNCDAVREAVGAEPAGRPAEIAAHLAGCTSCTAYAAELEAFDRKLRRALEIKVPVRAGPTVSRASAERRGAHGAPRGERRRARPQRWLALAASGVLAAVLVAAVLGVYPRQALGAAIAAHAGHEPGSWAATAASVPDSALGYVLGRAGVRLDRGVARISYAQSCFFRGWYVPHLVVQTDHGPMMVMVLAHERVSAATPISEGGYRGVIVPLGRGALAVLARGASDAAAAEAVAARVATAVSFID